MPSGADIIYQEALLNAPWHGYADFLLRVEAPSALGAYSYEVIDTRLARHTRPKHVVQLCVYSELLAREQGSLSNITCSFGTCLNATQLHQLCDGALRTVYLAFDSDHNGSGQRTARQLAQRLWTHRIEAFPVDLPDGHDPNSFFVHGGVDAHQFHALLDRARS